MNVQMKWVTIALCAVAVSGCFRYTGYAGDGHFTDRGWQNYSHRYNVDLGPLDITTASSKTFTLRGLPRAEFCIGLAAKSEAVKPSYNVIVRMILKSSDGQVIVSEEGPLRSWVAETALGSDNAFFYRQGSARDVPLPNGGTRGERLNVRASGGWGTYFNSESRAVYSLTVQILSSRASQDSSARLRLEGWDRNDG